MNTKTLYWPVIASYKNVIVFCVRKKFFTKQKKVFLIFKIK